MTEHNEQTMHVHVWQPNGTINLDNYSKSPVNASDDLLWEDVYSIAVCACGTTKKTKVGTTNVRRRWAENERRRGRR